MKTGKIYLVTNMANGKYYVGKTTRDDPTIRFAEHQKSKGATLLSCAIAKHGIDKFTFAVVAETSELAKLDDLERLWVAVLSANQRGIGYNRTGGGLDFSPTAREAQVENQRGRVPWNKGKKALQCGWNRGMKMSSEFRKKLSDAHKGKKLSEENKRKIGEALLGRKHSMESRRKMSENSRGKKKHRRPMLELAVDATKILVGQ